MEEQLIFDFPEGFDDYDKANAMMMFLVNRAAGFDKEKYDTVIVDFSKDNIGVVTWELCHILDAFFSIKFYTSSFIYRLPYYRKTKVIKYCPKFLQKFLEKKSKILYWDAESTADFMREDDVPKIYKGFTKKNLDFIAETLYRDWCVNEN